MHKIIAITLNDVFNECLGKVEVTDEHVRHKYHSPNSTINTNTADCIRLFLFYIAVANRLKIIG